jgi:glycyl-tRNA synthetase
MNENQELRIKNQGGLMEKIVSLCKRRGFVFPGSEIYGGLAGTWDYGPYGKKLKRNIEALWWRMFVEERDDMYEVDAAILMNKKVWEASGHVEGFSDPMVECEKCKGRFRADTLESEACPQCGAKGSIGESRQFNMMFKTHVGAVEDDTSVSYLRPETAQGMFVNFKNIVDSVHPKLPFGLAQIGKAFRNEIAPRDFLFRAREFEQMEVEYFVAPKDWERAFDEWKEIMRKFIAGLGISPERVHELEVPDQDRAHYSKRTIDFEYDYPFGRKELYGLAYRTDFDLSAHARASGANLEFLDHESGEKIIPHVIEPSLGMDRTILTVLLEAYSEDELGGEKRVYLKLPALLAPIKVAVFPLLRNKPELVDKARKIHSSLIQNTRPNGESSGRTKYKILNTTFDSNGNIGKRYRRQDEIGTPFCVTVDFETLDDDTVTVRERDSGEQERIAASELRDYLEAKL